MVNMSPPPQAGFFIVRRFSVSVNFPYYCNIEKITISREMKTLKITQKMTVRDNTLNEYLTDIGKYPLLTPDEEVALSERIAMGDSAAYDKLVRSNLRFVVSVAKQYCGTGNGLMDIIQEGNIGLSIAAQKFDPTKGFKFISYAVWWIRQSIINYIASTDRDIRLPMNKSSLLQAYNKFVNQYEVLHGETPDLYTIAEGMGIDEDKILEVIDCHKLVVSLDSKLSNDSDAGTLEEVTPSDEETSTNLDDESCRQDIERVLATLPDRERDCLSSFFGINRKAESYSEIADRYGLSRERVRQIVDKSIRVIKNSKRNEILRKYL